MNSIVGPDFGHGADKGLSGIHPDGCEKHRKAKVSKNDVGRQGHGPKHGSGTAELAENERNDQRPASDAERHDTDAGNRNRNKSEQNAQDHPDPERDIAEFGSRLHGVAEVTANLFLSIRRQKHTDPVAELQHEVRCRHQISIVSPNVQQMCRITGWHRKAGKRHADHAGLSDEDPDVVKVSAIACQSAGLEAPELRSRLGDRLFALGDDQDSVPCGQNRIGCWNEVAPLLSNHRDLDVGERADCQLVERLSGKGRANRNLGHMEVLGLRGEFGLHDARHEIDAEDRSDDPERICDGITNRWILVLHNVERRLKCRGTRHGPGVQTKRVAHRDAEDVPQTESNGQTG